MGTVTLVPVVQVHAYARLAMEHCTVAIQEVACAEKGKDVSALAAQVDGPGLESLVSNG